MFYVCKFCEYGKYPVFISDFYKMFAHLKINHTTDPNWGHVRVEERK